MRGGIPFRLNSLEGILPGYRSSSLLSRLSGDPVFKDANCSVVSGGVSLVTSRPRSPSVFAAIVSTVEVPMGQQNGDVSPPAILVCVR